MAKLTSFIALFLLLVLNVSLYGQDNKIKVIPKPTQVDQRDGIFVFNHNTSISVENKEQEDIVKSFIEQYNNVLDDNIPIKLNDVSSNIQFTTDKNLKSESYQLNITPDSIQIKASDNKGFFYALQTIRLLLPTNGEVNGTWSLPSVLINDEPRFEYRGLMLDVSRFFIPKENVLRIIDCMYMLKLIKLLLHVVYDIGW